MPHFEFADYQGVPLFVYGTLKTGHCNHRVIKPFVKDMKVAIAKDCTIASETAGLPMMFRYANHEVVGELMYLHEDSAKDAAARIDRLEGAPYLYNRELISVFVREFNEEVMAWAYTFSRDIGNFKPHNQQMCWRGP